MTTLTSCEFPRRSPLAMLVSVMMHGALVAALLYASYHHQRQKPDASQPISVTLVAPEVQPQPQPVAISQPEPEPEPPEPVVEPPKPEPVPVPKPQPEPKPKPKPVKKTVVKPKEVKPKPAQKPLADPFAENQTSKAVKPATAPKVNPSPVKSVESGPQAISTGKPVYPARAYALRIEGHVRIAFDVNNEGRVENIRILDARPQNMFEREVKQAMRSWRYQPGRPGQNITMNIQFRFEGGINLN
ncbi:TonB system transport protein TonB [Erwinia sp. OLTSP20]|uniref:energy transducer TonB n=1 Tax=unclassified Erwinia TaxID=2622719 RepID=UPI000C19619B|nr:MULTISPECIES: energy transducer TonB [unclassified Erwinia]PIJ51819.1 TonB system transport protein TonB [Erwinia sp. OAMSP11]PIJ74407.1 TonB system transport protein TonB [Erwinia sp. OLSSP12]PIJ83760.1 TonB system transport protein TonB [Erwinia sp. OLCASP19]PIJ86803.1 TonB system transport protein TonB [Erwinia sp. OLMTSP26]PIJ88210.1 TonB system transport protein TonB [Erwinia sp. OLMDSP33]